MLTLQDATNFNNAYKASPTQFNNMNRFAYGNGTATINKWLSQNTGIMNALCAVNDIASLNSWVSNYCKSYAQFALNTRPSVNIQDIEFWFRGAIGEWFIIDCFLSSYGNSFLVRNPQTNKVSQETFNLATPTAYTGCEDYGVDLIGIDKNNKGIVGQVKFYNPWASTLQIDYETLAKTNSQGVEELWIDPRQERSIYLFWLGNKQQGALHCNLSSYLLSPSCPLTKYNKVVYVDGNDINNTILPNFWTTTFQEKINLL